MSWIRPTDICVVTGGNKGLGREILKEFARQGCPTVSLDVASLSASAFSSNLETSFEPSPPRASGVPSLVADANSTEPDAFGPGATNECAADATSLEESQDCIIFASSSISDTMSDDSARCSTTRIEDETEDSVDLEPTLTIQCDVRSQEDLESARLQILKKFDRYPSIVVLNAGIRRPFNSIADSNYSDLQDTLDVNLGGVVKGIRTFLPDMIEGQRGFLISVSSALGIIVPKGLGAYGASKAGIIGFHEALRQELVAHKDIHAMLVCPGQLATTMFSDVRTPSTVLAPIVAPEKIAAKIVKRVRKVKSSTIYAPSYVRYLQLMNTVPVSLAQLVRKVSGVDRVYDDIMEKRTAQASELNVETNSEPSEAEKSCSLSHDELLNSSPTELALESANQDLSQPGPSAAVSAE